VRDALRIAMRVLCQHRIGLVTSCLYSRSEHHSCVHASAQGQQQQGVAAQPLCFDPTGVGELVFAAAALAAFAEPGSFFDTSEAFSMGRMVAQIPNEDPARLARVQDAKWRTIGVREASRAARLGYTTLAQLQCTYMQPTACVLLLLRGMFSVFGAFVSVLQVDCGALQRQVGERQAKEAFDAQRDRCNCLAALAIHLLQKSW